MSRGRRGARGCRQLWLHLAAGILNTHDATLEILGCDEMIEDGRAVEGEPYQKNVVDALPVASRPANFARIANYQSTATVGRNSGIMTRSLLFMMVEQSICASVTTITTAT